MRPFHIAALTVTVLICGAGPGLAFRAPQTNTAFPTEHQQAQQYGQDQSPPYAMNYADEAAQTLGVRDGRWEAFDTGSTYPLVPSLKGGVDSGGAMLRLQWRSGQ